MSAAERAARLNARQLPKWNPGGVRSQMSPRRTHAQGAWRGRDHWLTVVLPRVLERHPNMLTGKVARHTWLTVMAAHAAHAAADGANCIVRPDIIAAEVGLKSERHVQICRAIARRVGLMVDDMPGRMLTLEERVAAQRRGSKQRGMSTVSSLLIPADIDPRVHTPTHPRPGARPSDRSRDDSPGRAVDKVRPGTFIFTPSRGTNVSMLRYVPTTLPLTREESGGASRRSNHKVAGRPGTASWLGSELAGEVGWLRGTPGRRLAGLLRGFVAAQQPWTAQQLCDAMEAVKPFPPPSRAHHPLSLARWYLAQLDPDRSPAQQLADQAAAAAHAAAEHARQRRDRQRELVAAAERDRQLAAEASNPTIAAAKAAALAQIRATTTAARHHATGARPQPGD